MSIGVGHIIGITITIALIIGVGIFSGRKIKENNDFATGGGTAGAWIVCGTIMGALVGGQATLGTAQLAFLYGMSAWWFTLGSGIGCAILAWGYVKPMRMSKDSTLMEVIATEYGPRAEYIGSVLSSMGIIISIISQVVSGCALIMSLFDVNMWIAISIAVGLMVVYVIFGGVWGAGMGGIVKLILLYGLSIIGMVVVLSLTKGLGGLYDLVDGTVNSAVGQLTGGTTNGRYFNLLARGASKDIGSGISLILGVLSTQTYAQAIWSAKNNSKAKKGAMLSAVLIPPIGIACIAIGLFMRGHCITAAELTQLTDMGQAIPKDIVVLDSTAQVFPAFIINYMPPVVGGMALGTLLITIVGGGAGLALGVSVILVDDILIKVKPSIEEKGQLTAATRTTLILVLCIASVIGGLASDAIINDMGFLSMGLRGAVVFLPFTCALFLKNHIDPRAITASIALGPVAVIIGNLIGLPFDPLFLGVGINLLCVALGYKKI